MNMWEKELEAMQEAALLAQKRILEIYHTDFAVDLKEDHSVVTKADKEADAIIRTYLHTKFPEYAFLTEESKDTKERLSNDYVFIVDPVDGTQEFVHHNDEFTTNIALAYKHEIVVGVINVPVKGELSYAIKGEGAYLRNKDGKLRRLSASKRNTPPYICLLSRSFSVEKEKELIKRHEKEIAEVRILGAATKFLAIAKGEADMFYRFSGGTKEWDVAPGDLIVTEAGGYMIKPDGSHYAYNRDDVYNHDGYILLNDIKNRLF